MTRRWLLHRRFRGIAENLSVTSMPD